MKLIKSFICMTLLALSLNAYGWGAEVPYAATFNKTEILYDLPKNLLVEVARQESSFRPEVINCKVTGPNGSLGMMQLNPRYFNKAYACEPELAIVVSAKYLYKLHERFDTWYRALMAYNWGPTNLDRALKDAKLIPTSVQKYAFSILDRVRK